MGLLFNYVKRNLNEHLGRTSLMMLSLFVVSIVVAIGIAASIMGKSIMTQSNNSMYYDVTITSGICDKLDHNIMENVDKKFEWMGYPSGEMGYVYNAENDLYTCELISTIDFAKAQNSNQFYIEKGKFVEVKGNEAIVTKKFAEANKLKDGDTFYYYGRNSEKHELVVKKVLKSFGSLEVQGNILTTEEEYLKITNLSEMSYEYCKAKYKGDESELLENSDKIEEELGISLVTNKKNIMESAMGTKLKLFIVAAILVFVVIYVSLNSLVKIIVNERISDIGTFRSVGATKSQIMKMLIMELSIYSIVPSFIGSIIAVLILKSLDFLLAMANEMMGWQEEITVIKIAPTMVVGTVLLTLAFQLLLSLGELFKVSKMSIKETIFNKHVSKYKFSILKAIIGIFSGIIGVVTLLKWRYLTFTYCLIGIFAVFISINYLVPLINLYVFKYIRKSKNPVLNMAIGKVKNNSLQINTNIIFIITACVSLLSYSILNYYIFVANSKVDAVQANVFVEKMLVGTPIVDISSDLVGIEHVSDYASLFTVNINTGMYDSLKIANHSVEDINLVYSKDYSKLNSYSKLINIDENKVGNLGTYEVILSEYYKDIFELNVGDTIVLEWGRNEKTFSWNTPTNLKIVGFEDLSKIGNNTMIISEKLGDLVGKVLLGGYSDIKYFLKLDTDDQEEAVKIRKYIINDLKIYSNGTSGNVFTKAGYQKNQTDSVKTNKILMIGAVVIIVSLSLIGIINNQMVSFLERKRELATLYSVAMSRKQLKDLVLIENTVSFICSAIISIGFYIIISKIVEQTLKVLYMPIYVKFTLSGVLILLLVMGLILFGIQRNMRKRINNMNIVEEIKYE